VRSDRLFCETLDYSILFRWFLDMSLEEPTSGFRRSRFKGRERTQLFALIVGTAYNQMRMARILEKPAAA